MAGISPDTPCVENPADDASNHHEVVICGCPFLKLERVRHSSQNKESPVFACVTDVKDFIALDFNFLKLELSSEEESD